MAVPCIGEPTGGCWRADREAPLCRPGDRADPAQPAVPDQAVREGHQQGNAGLHADQSQGAALGRQRDGCTARARLVPAVLPGQSQVVLAELGGTIDGATQLYVRVDDPNRVPESDDGNIRSQMK